MQGFIIWGGGNELQRKESDCIIDEREPVIRVLADCVKELDKGRYFLPSSPTGRLFNNTLENIEDDWYHSENNNTADSEELTDGVRLTVRSL